MEYLYVFLWLAIRWNFNGSKTVNFVDCRLDILKNHVNPLRLDYFKTSLLQLHILMICNISYYTYKTTTDGCNQIFPMTLQQIDTLLGKFNITSFINQFFNLD